MACMGCPSTHPAPPTQSMTAGGRCGLCGRLAKESAPHACDALSRMAVDLSALPEYSADWTKEPLTTTRDLPGHWVTVFKDEHGRLARHHLIVAQSPFGLGAYTVSGLQPLHQAERATAAETAPEQTQETKTSAIRPREDMAAIGRYTGLLQDEATDEEDERLAALTLQDGTRIDPNSHGGMLVRLNSAHGTAANVCPVEDDNTMTLMKAAIKAAAGEELRWDYVAVTDDPNDPLNAPCKCRGKRCFYKELNLWGRACTGTLMELQILKKKK
jgi:hypothetical protein